MNKITIAIDGHSSCGKSTMAKQLAVKLGYTYVDTGAMYRAVTLYALRAQLFDSENNIDKERLQSLIGDIEVKQAGNATFLNGEDVSSAIRTMDVSTRVSYIAALPFVRQAMVKQQQLMGEHGGVVMDGRDIGTTVFPNAELKIFVTASAEVRAERRYKEMIAKGLTANYDEILANVKERDYLDSHREVSPLVQAADALQLDNRSMPITEHKDWLLARLTERLQP